MKFATWIGIVLLLATADVAHAQRIHRNNFEADKTDWTPGPADTQNDVISHISTDRGAHGGQRSEYLQLNAKAKADGFIYYQYPIGKAPLTEELSGGLWLKANIPGLQLVARIILPNERDPKNLEAPMSTLIRGDIYQLAGRWQRISIGRPILLAKQQQQLLQNKLQRQVNFNDAYVDAILLNVYGSPGPIELYIDDLEIGPVMIEPTPAAAANAGPNAVPVARGPQVGSRPKSSRPAVEFNGTNLLVGGRPFFMRGVKVTDTPVAKLHAAGFNTIFIDAGADPKIAKEAADLGMWIVPMLPLLTDDPKYSSADGLAREIQRLSEQDGILFWHMGRNLTFEQANSIERAIQIVRQADPGRPLGGDVVDGLKQYSQSLNLLSVPRMPLMTSLELPRYREWQEMRRRLMNMGAFTWSWVQTNITEENAHLLYGQSSIVNFSSPVGPQSEQVRLLAYSALANGNKGIAYTSDRFLADSHFGGDRLLECGLINQEIEMLEPMLAGFDDSVQWIPTSNPDVTAAIMRTSKGILVLPMWQGRGAQLVPGQAAVSKLAFVVPQVPGNMQAWEVLPGDVRGLRIERVVGGTRVVVPEFGLTTAVVFTSDTNLVVRFQEGTRSRRQLAAQWTYDLAKCSLEKILNVEDQLERMGHTLNDGAHLKADAKGRLEAARKYWDTKVFSEAYRESQRALRPARILMRAQWEAAVKDIEHPTASPYALSFYTLPKHWEMMEQVKSSTAGANVLPGGDFETVPANPQDSWHVDEATLDEVDQITIRVTEVQGPLELKKPGSATSAAQKAKTDGTLGADPTKSLSPTTVEQPKEGKQCALLQIRPKNRLAAPLALERTQLSLTSPAVKLAPGTLVRVSAWVRIPTTITASSDGALFFDSAGGEALAVRFVDANKEWKKVSLLRYVPESGQISVTLKLTGLGSVYFDDVRIEPFTPGTATVPGNLVSNPK